MRPHASKCIHTYPNRSKQVETGLDTSENFEKLAKTMKKRRETRKMLAKLAILFPSPVQYVIHVEIGRRLKSSNQVLGFDQGAWASSESIIDAKEVYAKKRRRRIKKRFTQKRFFVTLFTVLYRIKLRALDCKQ